MENITIAGSRGVFFIPSIDFNAQTGICEIGGESYLEETAEFYDPLIEWLKRYTKEIRKPITFNIKLTYYNTSSSRYILDFLDVLKLFEESGGNTTVNWYCQEEELKYIEEDVDDYMIQSQLKINIIVYQ